MDEQRTPDTPIRVVLAEDHALVREGTVRILDAAVGIEVVGEAADGEQAITVVTEQLPDVAVLDIGMPRCNGIEATRRIKKDHPEVGVLVLTVHDDDEFIFAALEAGAAGYLLKDVDGDRLVDAILAVAAGESVLHPAVTHRVLQRLVTGETEQAQPDPALTDREHEVLRLAARGLANKEIGRELGITERTVQTHLTNVFRKLAVGSRTEAVLVGLRRGWFDLDDLEDREPLP